MILIASPSAETLAHCEDALHGSDVVVTVRQITAVSECLRRIRPPILVLDIELPGLDGPKGVVDLRSASPSTKIIALTRLIFDELELALFKAGVHGCCRSDVAPELLRRAVAAVQNGELWIRRSITPRLLNELSARLRRDTEIVDNADRHLSQLTSREREIAEMIGHGESNKQIARQLLITERTVKAHVSGILRKLGVADRLSVALRVSSRRRSVGERVN